MSHDANKIDRMLVAAGGDPDVREKEAEDTFRRLNVRPRTARPLDQLWSGVPE